MMPATGTFGIGSQMSQEAAIEAEPPMDNVGAQLARARADKGLGLAELSAITKIRESHLLAIETGNFAALPARMYAVGFARTYAKALGLDQHAIAAALRNELDAREPADEGRASVGFEPGDPARVPSPALVWFSLLGVIAAVVAGLLFWRSYYAPAGSLPSILPSETPAPARPAPVAATPAPAPTTGPVVFTATAPGIWVRFYDGAGKTLLEKQLAQGESWTVPADAGDVRIWTGRPEALAITVGGQAVPPLADTQRTVKDVAVTAAALLARAAPPQPQQAVTVAPQSARPVPSRKVLLPSAPSPASQSTPQATPLATAT